MLLIRTKVLALLAAAAVVLPAIGTAHAAYLCRMTGEISESCCCMSEHAAQPCDAEIEREECCRRIQTGAQSVSAMREGAQRIAPVASIQTFELPVRLLAADSPTCEVPPRIGLHPPGRPRFLVHCAFLI